MAGVMGLGSSTQPESPVRENRTGVREYEETIEQLKKENFDLRLRRFLLEETLEKYMREGQNVQVVVELGFELNAYKKELSNKEKLLQEALEQNEKYLYDIKELQQLLQQPATEVPLEEAWVALKDEKEHFENEASRLADVLNEKDTIIQNANEQIKNLSQKNATLEAKTLKKSAALQGVVHKYHKEIGVIPQELRTFVEEAVQAAKECKPQEMNAALGKLKASLCKVMLPTSVREFSSAQKENGGSSKTKTTVSALQKLPEASQSVREVDQSTHSNTKFVHVNKEQSPTQVKILNQSSESINDDENENWERMMNAVKDNEHLRADNEEKSRTIEGLNSTCGELERRTIQLQSELTEAMSKVKKLEMRIREDRSKSASSLPKENSSVQTDFSTVDDLKEEILRLELVIQQKDKELSDNEQNIETLQSHLEKIDSQNNQTLEKDIDEAIEINDLHERLALSCQVNHDLMAHLRKLEAFMEDLLHHKNLDSSSLSETSTRLTNCLDETKKLSSALSDHLSICENSKLFDSSDISLKRSYSQSGRQSFQDDHSRLNKTSNSHYTHQGRNTFLPSESRTGKRRLSFSTLHNASRIDSENVVVLGTSNNEDLILLLNEKGHPEDVLIRNNPSQQYLDNNNHPQRYLDNSNLPQQYLDSSLGFPSEMFIPKCPSSDSDIWSEPDRDVSMQRIGIDVQLSPAAQKSPRRLRLRDSKRTTDELSSQRNESSCSGAVKFQPWSKRRRSGDTLKSPSACKKCSPSPSKDESAERVQLQKVVSDLSNKCSNQENELDELREALNNAKTENNALTEQKRELTTFINILEKELKIKTTELSLQSTESSGSLAEISGENSKLRKSIELLETKSSESDSVIKKLNKELEDTKMRLQSLDNKCSNYELELASSSKNLKDYNEKYGSVVNEKDQLLNKVQELVSKRNELLESIQSEKAKIQQFEKENGELKGELRKKSESLASLQSQYTELQNSSSELLREKESKLLSSSSTCNELQAQLKSYESVVEEKNELFEKIQKLGETKNELLQSIQLEKNKMQEFEKENRELKRKLHESSQSLASLQSQCTELEKTSSESQESLEREKNKLLQQIQKFDSTKRHLCEEIESENNRALRLDCQIWDLKTELQEKSLSLESLQSQYAKLEKTSAELLREKDSELLTSSSTCNDLKKQLKKYQESYESLKQSCTSLERDSSKIAENKIRVSLLKVKSLFTDNLQNLRDVCKLYLNWESEIAESIDNYLSARLSTYDNGDKIEALFTDINSVSTMFTQIIQFLSNQISSVQHKSDRDATEIQSLENQNSQLKADITSLKLTENESRSLTEESKSHIKHLEKQNRQLNAHIGTLRTAGSGSETRESKSQIELLQQDKLNAQEDIRVMNSDMKAMQEYVKDIKHTLSAREKHLEELKLKHSSLEAEFNSLQKKVEENQRLLESKDDQISELEYKMTNSGIQLRDSVLKKLAAVSQNSASFGNPGTGSFSALDPSKSCPNVSSASEGSDARRETKKSLKSLKAKLVVYEKRIEILEKEKSDLRDELRAQAQRSRQSSSDEADNLRKELAAVKETLEAKTSFIKDLKSEMFTNCNSLVDKQKEVDDMRRQLCSSKELCTQLKLKSKEERPKFRFSDHMHSDVEAEIKTLKRRKWDLIQSILEQQKQFYECKNIHLGHLEKFKTRIEEMHTSQGMSTTMLRSDSEPFLNSIATENNRCAEKWDLTLKNLQTQLELDIECLQNLAIFLRRFFSPLVLQSCEHCSKSNGSSPKRASSNLEKSASSPAKTSHDNTSDRESLSEEILHLSRSGSVSPMSFEGLFQSFKNQQEQSQKNSTSAKEMTYSSGLPHKSSNIASGSQESIFNQRSHFSSPDLGIESDPNHESSAPEQGQDVSRLSKRQDSGSRGNVPESPAQTLAGSLTTLQDRVPYGSGDASLHAMGSLHHYELLKKEVSESLVGIKSVLIRARDGLQRTSKFTSPGKNLEYATFMAIKDTSGDIEVCLEAATKMVDKFWIAPCPSVEELNNLIQLSQEQHEQIRRMTEAKVKQEQYWDVALARLKQAEIEKNKLEKKISKRLVSTKKVIRAAEVKLLEQGKSQIPMPKYPEVE